jgi:mevalonate kinase
VLSTRCLARFAEDIIQGIASGMDVKIQVARATVVIFISNEMMNANVHLLKCVMNAFCLKDIGARMNETKRTAEVKTSL